MGCLWAFTTREPHKQNSTISTVALFMVSRERGREREKEGERENPTNNGNKKHENTREAELEGDQVLCTRRTRSIDCRMVGGKERGGERGVF